METSFKENLRKLLDYKDITIKELSFNSGVPKRSIENYLNARASMPPADYACKIAKALGTSVEYLVNGETADNQNISTEAIEIAKIYQKLPKKDKDVIERVTQALSHL